MGMVEFENLEVNADIAELKELIENHFNFTGSTVAKEALDNWEATLKQFVKVMPTDYKRVLNEKAEAAKKAS